MCSDNVPTRGDQVTNLVKVVSERKADLKEDEDCLKGLLAALLRVIATDVWRKGACSDR